MRPDNLTPPFFQDEPLPEGASLAGWAALVSAFGIPAPVRNPTCISKRHVRGNVRADGIWQVYDKRYWPAP